MYELVLVHLYPLLSEAVLATHYHFTVGRVANRFAMVATCCVKQQDNSDNSDNYNCNLFHCNSFLPQRAIKLLTFRLVLCFLSQTHQHDLLVVDVALQELRALAGTLVNCGIRSRCTPFRPCRPAARAIRCRSVPSRLLGM
jgi:hypothetical protein